MADLDALADRAAEQIVLGSMMLDPAAIDDVTEWIDAADHYAPAHQIVHEAIMALYLSGQPHDPVAVAAYMADHPELGRHPPADYLHTLIATVPASVNGGWYAAEVAKWSQLRRWEEAGTRIRQAARSGDRDQLAELAAVVAGEVGAARSHGVRGAADGLMTATMYATTRRDQRPPVIPGLLHCEERVVWVGTPGQGKTTVLLQCGFALAAGQHPFVTGHAIEPARVLYVDLENRPGILARKLDRMIDLAQGFPGWDPARMMIWTKRSGLDLRGAHGQQVLAQVLRKAAPDLVIAGPVNKMLIDDGAAGGHQQVAWWWDSMQERLGFALMLEHHPPLKQNLGKRREIRGAGSAVWEQWPEFTLIMEPAGPKAKPGSLVLGRQRGDREEGRMWPDSLERRGIANGPGWPWVAIYPRDTPRPQPASGGMRWSDHDDPDGERSPSAVSLAAPF